MSTNNVNSELINDWQEATQETCLAVGDRLSGTGLLLANSCSITLVEGDFRFDPVPQIKGIDDTVEITCNIDAYDEWSKILSVTPDLHTDDIRKVYLGIAASKAELSLVANSSIRETSKLSGAQRMSIGKRAIKVLELFSSREKLGQYANLFENQYELWGLEDLIVNDLSESQILRINQLRYGIAVSMFALDLEPEVEKDITKSFAEHLKDDISSREESLLQFLQSFAGEDYDDVTRRQEMINAYSFPELLFAGTIPMDIFEVLE